VMRALLQAWGNVWGWLGALLENAPAPICGLQLI
jgi:hypothetical protein